MEILRPLPDRRVESAKRVRVRVNSGSLIVVERNLCDSRRHLTEPEIQELIDTLERQQESLLRNGRIFAARNLLDLPEISKLAQSERVRELAEAVLGESAFAVPVRDF